MRLCCVCVQARACANVCFRVCAKEYVRMSEGARETGRETKETSRERTPFWLLCVSGFKVYYRVSKCAIFLIIHT